MLAVQCDWLLAADLGSLVGQPSDDLRGSVQRTAAGRPQPRIPPETAGQAEVGQLEAEQEVTSLLAGSYIMRALTTVAQVTQHTTAIPCCTTRGCFQVFPPPTAPLHGRTPKLTKLQQHSLIISLHYTTEAPPSSFSLICLQEELLS